MASHLERMLLFSEISVIRSTGVHQASGWVHPDVAVPRPGLGLRGTRRGLAVVVSER